MALEIKSGFWSSSFLAIDSKGLKFYDAGAWGSARRIPFADVQNVLLSPKNLLSFQVADKVYSIRTNPDNAKHQKAIEILVQAVRGTLPRR